MDFITELPLSAGLYTQIWVVVDRFTKMAHFVALPADVTAEQLARKFLYEIWKLHGLPEEIVSDRDAKFTSKFWSALMEALGVERKLSTSFHPQTDGQTERVNQSIEQYLRSFCNYDQDDWYELLPLAEYAYNNSITSATDMSPFYANYGFHPKVTWLKQAEIKNPAAELYAHWMEEVHQQCREQLEKTQARMSKYYDSKRLPITFNPGDKVLLDGRNLKTKRSSKKLDHKMYGPYAIAKLIGTRAAKLQLPKAMKCHDVFNVSLLEPYKASSFEGRSQEPPPPVVVDGEEEYIIERIIKSEKRKARRGNKWWVEYLVKWENYPPGESTWETVDAFQAGAYHFLRQFHLDNPKAPMNPSLSHKDLTKDSDWDD